jgi:large subunit ribosomal protein L35
MKTNRGAAKRFGYSASGKLRHAKSNRRHLLTKKAPKRKRALRGMGATVGGDAKRIRRFLPRA